MPKDACYKASIGGYGKTLANQTAKRPSKNPNIARGCGKVMNDRRKVTKIL